MTHSNNGPISRPRPVTVTPPRRATHRVDIYRTEVSERLLPLGLFAGELRACIKAGGRHHGFWVAETHGDGGETILFGRAGATTYFAGWSAQLLWIEGEFEVVYGTLIDVGLRHGVPLLTLTWSMHVGDGMVIDDFRPTQIYAPYERARTP